MNYIENGRIEMNEFVDLTFNHIDNILKLQYKIINELKIKSHFIANDRDFFTEVIHNRDSIFLGLFDKSKLIAYCLVLKDIDDYIKYFSDFGITPALKSANFDIVVVDPAYRGEGLHRLFIDTVIEQMINEKYQEIYCTVHPDNSYSLSNFTKKGFKKVADIIKPNNYKRVLLKKTL